jgi:nitroreductase
MDFIDLINARYSCRAYRSDPVPGDDLAHVLEAARLAPTADNRQAFGVVVITVAGREAELRRVYKPDWFVQAPLVLAVCGVRGREWTRRTDGWSALEVDAAIVTDHMVLAAADRGLGTCWVCAFDPVAAREVLGVPDGVEPIAFTPLGLAADSQGERKRRGLNELVHGERW